MLHDVRVSQAIAAVVLMGSVLTGCDSSPVAPEATEIRLHDGHDQWALAGENVPVAPRVLVRTASGSPVSGITVSFHVAEGGGTVAVDNVTTGSDGTASVSGWRLGSSAGENALVATASGVGEVRFRALGLTREAVSGVEVLSIQNAQSGITESVHRLIDSQEEWSSVWAAAYAEYAPSQVPAMPVVDFSTEVVVLSAAGFRGAQGFTYQINHVGLTDAGLQVYVLEDYAHCGTLPGLSSPVHALRVPRVAHTATFHFDLRKPICD
jgi:hypothetical protein